MHTGSIKIRITSSIPEIERLNRLVRRFGELHELPSRALYSVNLALDEAVTNAVLHGYGAEIPDGPIDITVEAGDRDVVATVADRGRAFDPLSLPTPDLHAPLDERAIGGLGIHLIRNLMDSVEYERRDDHNLLTLRKRLR